MKKLFAFILILCIFSAMVITASAEDYSTTGDRGMIVTYSVSPTYMVTIPASITIGAEGTASDQILLENVVVEKGKYVSVSLSEGNSFTVTTPEQATLSYTVTVNGNAVVAGGEILAVNPTDGKTGSADITFNIDTDTIQYAGTYTGTASFTVSVKDNTATNGPMNED